MSELIDPQSMAHAGTVLMIERLRFAVRRARLHIGARIMGPDWFGVVTALWIIRDRALDAVSEDGRVVLAKCEPLAEVLYKRLPGAWSLRVSRLDEGADKPGESTSRAENDTTPESVDAVAESSE